MANIKNKSKSLKCRQKLLKIDHKTMKMVNEKKDYLMLQLKNYKPGLGTVEA